MCRIRYPLESNLKTFLGGCMINVKIFHLKKSTNKITFEFYRIFQTVRQYFGQHNESIPMSFVLGFYVSLVVKRWWEQYRMLPWPDTLALFISAAIPGNVSKINTRGESV